MDAMEKVESFIGGQTHPHHFPVTSENWDWQVHSTYTTTEDRESERTENALSFSSPPFSHVSLPFAPLNRRRPLPSPFSSSELFNGVWREGKVGWNPKVDETGWKKFLGKKWEISHLPHNNLSVSIRWKYLLEPQSPRMERKQKFTVSIFPFSFLFLLLCPGIQMYFNPPHLYLYLFTILPNLLKLLVLPFRC